MSISINTHYFCDMPYFVSIETNPKEKHMKLVAFAASNSQTSINKAMVTHAAQVMKSEIAPGTDVEIIDLNDYEMPIYSSDIEKAEGIPDTAHAFFNKIGSADALLISYAEHNGSYTAAFKNVFDWTSRIDMKVYQDKPMVVLSASPGPGGGAHVVAAVKSSAPFFGGNIRADLSVGEFNDNFDTENGEISNPETQAELRSALATLQ